MAKKTNNAVLDLIQSKYPGYHPLMSIADIAHNPDPNIDNSLHWLALIRRQLYDPKKQKRFLLSYVGPLIFS